MEVAKAVLTADLLLCEDQYGMNHIRTLAAAGLETELGKHTIRILGLQ